MNVTRLYGLLIKSPLETKEGSPGLLYPSKCVGSFQDGSVLVCHKFGKTVSLKFVNTCFDIDRDEVLNE